MILVWVLATQPPSLISGPRLELPFIRPRKDGNFSLVGGVVAPGADGFDGGVVGGLAG